jgi:hypothetical protein
MSTNFTPKLKNKKQKLQQNVLTFILDQNIKNIYNLEG